MNHDTNREDRVEPRPIPQEWIAKQIVNPWPTSSVICLGCGAKPNPYGNLPCPCGQGEQS